MTVDKSDDAFRPDQLLKPVKELKKEYIYDGKLDAKEWQILVVLNLVGLVLFLLFGWLFWSFTQAVRTEDLTGGLSSVFSGVNLLWLILGVVGVIIVHELIHGFMFWLFTRERPQFGLAILYAYAAAPDWYLPRNQFLITAMAPFTLITLVGLILLAVVPNEALDEILLVISLNAAASVGDLYASASLLMKPRSLMINDVGTKLTFFKVPSADVAKMSVRWLDLIQSLGVDQGKAREIFAGMVKLYNAPGRYYHNLAHVGLVFDTADRLRQLAKDYETVEIAIWFHDVIYDPRSKENEKLSAAYARQALAEMGIPAERIARVSDLILATITHQAGNEDIDAQILLDSDLAPLAYEEALFFEQSDALRKEFSYIPDEEYQNSRVIALTKFLSRKRIYQTEQLYGELEGKARQNLETSVNRLSS